MSQFYSLARKFCDEFHIAPLGRLKFFMHYPLFKLAWHSSYGSGIKKTIASELVPLMKNYSFRVTAKSNSGKTLEIPISFHIPNLDSFHEIFLGQAYSSPASIGKIQSFIDLGANTGMAALFFLIKHPIQSAILVEANPLLAKSLQKLSLQNAGICKIIVENICVTGVSTSPVDFFVSSDHRMSNMYSAVHDKGHAVRVKAVPLRDLLKSYELERVDLLKMDIEGAEFDILDNDPSVFKKFDNIFAEIHGDESKRKEFSNVLVAQGFEILDRHTLGHAYEMIVATRTELV